MSLVGRLEDLGLSDIFQILSVGRKTGTLIIRGGRGNAIIVFKNGLVVRAEGDFIENTIADNLLELGKIKESTYKMAMDVKATLPDKPLAEILYEFEAVKKDVLDKVSKKRIEKIVFSILLWGEGSFQFELDDLNLDGKVELSDAGWEVSKGISPEYLLMEGARVYDESSAGMSIMDEEFSDEPSGAEEAGGGWGGDEWGGGGRKDMISLRTLTQELRFPNSTSEITLLILRFASDIFVRGVLFMVGDEYLQGLGQFGLDIDRADERIREMRIAYRDSKFLDDIVRRGETFKAHALPRDAVTELMMDEFGGNWPQKSALYSIIANNKVVALLYADNLTEGDAFPETEGLEIFVSQAGLALEKALLQRKIQELEHRV